MKLRLLSVALILVLLSLACNMPVAPATTPTVEIEALTQVALTLDASIIRPETETPEPDDIEQETPQPTVTSGGPPTPTSAPATATPQPCDAAQFIADVTIPDGTRMNPGEVFTKTWRLRNIGTCTWDTRYAMVFASGESMGAPAAVNLPGSVPPNATVDLSVELRAPNAPGTYYSNWRLRNPAGQTFGVMANQPFFAHIVVAGPTATVTPAGAVTNTPPTTGIIYDFAANVCQAQWLSESGDLPCPGLSGDNRGYVMLLENPRLETGAIESSPVLLTHPNNAPTGAIVGRYPAVQIQSGYRFQATLGCVSGMNNCSVIYQLNYSIGGGAPVPLGEWTQTYDGSIQGINVDLSQLAGQSIEIIMVVLANGSADQDQAVWVHPRLIRQ
jgi:hypothetical protein